MITVGITCKETGKRGHESLVPVVGAALVPISRATVLEEVLMGYV
jgi:hypothetical protein